MGRPQVLSPIAHNIPSKTRRESGGASASAAAVNSGNRIETSKATAQGKARGGTLLDMNDDALGSTRGSRDTLSRSTSTGRRFMARYRANLRVDERFTKTATRHNAPLDDEHEPTRASNMAGRASSSSSRRAASNHISTAASNSVAAETPRTNGGVMGATPSMARSASTRSAAQARQSSRSESIDSSASSASQSSRHSSQSSNGNGAHGKDIDAVQGRHRTFDGSVMRTPTLQRNATFPSREGGRLTPLGKLTTNGPRNRGLQNDRRRERGEQVERPMDPQLRRKSAREAIVEIFSPMRAMRVARAGMKRKHGDGNRKSGIARHQSGMVSARGPLASGSGSPGPMARGEEEQDAVKRSSFVLAEGASQEGARHESSRKQTRDISSSHLRRNMRAMRLSDRDESMDASMVRKASTAKSTRSASSRSSSYHRQASAGSSSRSTRNRSSTYKAPSDNVTAHSHTNSSDTSITEYDDAFKDVDEGELHRLLTQAPSWQLSRLNKTQLQTLHMRLGTWQAFDVVDLEVFTKQDLVDGIIKSRSTEAKPITPSSAGSGPSCDTSVRSRRRSSGALSRSVTLSTLTSQSSEYTDDSEGDDAHKHEDRLGTDTDANDAAGEETEVEPSSAAGRRQSNSTNVAANSPILHRLRHAHSRYKLYGGPQAGSSSMTSSSKLALANQQSRTTYIATSPAKRRLRHQPSVAFAAASPAHTRARARNMSSSSSRKTSVSASRSAHPYQQRTLLVNAKGEIMLTDAPPLPRRRQQRTKEEVAAAAAQRRLRTGPSKVSETDDGDESSNAGKDALHHEEDTLSDQQAWEDDSPPASWRLSRVAQRNHPRNAKTRALQQMDARYSAAEDSEALVEEALGDGGRYDDDKMSLSEQSTESESRDALASDMSLDDSQDTFVLTHGSDANGLALESDADGNDLDDESELSEVDSVSENEVQASPSKMRRLRNGKVRYHTTPTAEKGEKAAQLVLDASDDEMDEEEDLPEMTMSSLSKLKRDQLIDLCDHLNVEYTKDATRAILIDALLAEETHDPGSIGTTRPVDSSASVRTARPNGSNRSPKGRRESKEGEESKRPLLLRSGSLPPQSQKPNTPQPSQQGEEELNGLDLESLNLVDKEIPFSKLEKIEKIGSGGFKDVYVGKYHISKKTSKKVAICDIRDQLSEMDIKELTLLRDLKHENIVRFIGVSIPPPEMRLTPCIIVSELCSNGDLYDYIRNTEPPADHDIFRILLETARGLEYLHTRSPAIIHRDCKSTNVLVTRNKTAKINDFGLARVRNNKRSMIKSLVGTVNWQAVELWQPKPSYNEKVDVWSAAMTFWETLQWHQPEKKYPFQDMNEHQIYQDVGQKKLRPPTISIRRRYGTEIVDLLDRMWDHNAKERPTMTQVCTELEHLVLMKKEIAAEKAASSADAVDAANRRSSVSTGTRKSSR